MLEDEEDDHDRRRHEQSQRADLTPRLSLTRDKDGINRHGKRDRFRFFHEEPADGEFRVCHQEGDQRGDCDGWRCQRDGDAPEGGEVSRAVKEGGFLQFF